MNAAAPGRRSAALALVLQALLVAAVLGSRTDLTVIRANAAAASFA